MEQKYYSSEETERYLDGHVSKKTLANWRSDRKNRGTDRELPYTKMGRKVVYCKADLDAWLARNRKDVSAKQ